MSEKPILFSGPPGRGREMSENKTCECPCCCADNEYEQGELEITCQSCGAFLETPEFIEMSNKGYFDRFQPHEDDA